MKLDKPIGNPANAMRGPNPDAIIAKP